MKLKPYSALLVALLLALSATAQTDYALKSVKASIKGTSTLHDWESNITKIEWKGVSKADQNALIMIQNVEVKVPVKSIKSKEGSIMDNKTYDAFKEPSNPYIIYTSSTPKVTQKANNVFSIEAPGNLTMAGTTKSITLKANGKVLDNGDLNFTISQKLKMTEYNMKPPTAVLGTIQVGDEVTVLFDVTLTRTN